MLAKCSKLLIASVIMLTLAACSVKLPEQNTYTLTKVNPNTIHARNTHQSLLVSRPTALAAYATKKMVYIKTPYQIQYYAENQWIDEPAHLLGPLMVKSLRHTKHFSHVVAEPYAGNASYRIDTQLLELQQNFITNPSIIELSVNVNVFNNKTEQLIASKTFTVSACAPGNNPYSGVLAANNAVAELLAKIAVFVVRVT